MVKHDQQKVNKCLHLRTEGVAFILFIYDKGEAW
jgi:hypothetical protein